MSDCDLPDVYVERMVVARKQYGCVECQHRIFPGEKYQRIKGLWGGEWATYSTCECCARARCALADELDFGECVAIGSLAEEMAGFEQCRAPLNTIITVPPESM